MADAPNMTKDSRGTIVKEQKAALGTRRQTESPGNGCFIVQQKRCYLVTRIIFLFYAVRDEPDDQLFRFWLIAPRPFRRVGIKRVSLTVNAHAARNVGLKKIKFKQRHPVPCAV